MDDPRLLPLIATILVSYVVAGASISMMRWVGDETKRTPGRFLFAVIWIPTSIALCGWVDQTLWNMLAPTFGLPELDLLTAVIGGFLISSLFWSTSGIRSVRVIE